MAVQTGRLSVVCVSVTPIFPDPPSNPAALVGWQRSAEKPPQRCASVGLFESGRGSEQQAVSVALS